MEIQTSPLEQELFQPSLQHPPGKISQLTKEVLHRTPSTVALTLYPATLIYHLPTWDLPQEINVLYFKKRTFSKTCVGKDKCGNGVTVRRYFRGFPPEAVVEIDQQPVLRLEWLLLDFLLLKNPFTALTTANAIFRILLDARRENPQSQQLEMLRWLTQLESLTRRYISGYYQKRVLRRLKFLNPLAESPLESVLEVAFRQLGYCSYRTQAPIQVPQTTFYADGLLPRIRTVIEADGQGKRRADPELLRQNQRERLIKAAGFQVIRFSTNDCWDPRLHLRICAKLGARPPAFLRRI